MSMSSYSEVIHRTRYARWNEEEKRRENWPETVERYFDFFSQHLKTKHSYTLKQPERDMLTKAVVDLDVMPSMRALMTAGPALERVQMSNFNCTYNPIDTYEALPEIMYILMTGSGNGFSVERRYTQKLPFVPMLFQVQNEVIKVEDSREGWCEAYRKLLKALYSGYVCSWDVSKVRPAGARLKTFGGYASGPGPLVELFEYTVQMFLGAAGRRLRPIEVFGLATYVAQIVVVGGVRRSATICLFDADDNEMINAKADGMYSQDADGKWVPGPKAHYAMANISAVFENKPSLEYFDKFWGAMRAGGKGEPGIFNRAAFDANAARIGRPNINKRGQKIEWGANPCCEIQLRPYQACNLTAAVIRPKDTLADLKQKVVNATVLGTWQACVTDFEYIRPLWKENIDEERLLGVSLTGFYDHPVLSVVSEESGYWMRELRDIAQWANRVTARELGIPVSASVTTVKPAGNSGQLYDVASGIHPRHAPYYLRRIRQSTTDPLTAFLQANGVPMEESAQSKQDRIFAFPIKAPKSAHYSNTLDAMTQLKHWMHVKNNWATHTVSCTISVRDHEWEDVKNWVYENFDDITGLSFFPADDNTYQQAPYETITAEQYETLASAMPEIDWDLLRHFESHDTTTTGHEFACVGNQCELTT